LRIIRNIFDDNGNFGCQELNPDLVIRRPGGYFDILDLKLAKVDKASLFQWRDARRRFIDYVSEGLSQLANYRHYFFSPVNARWAERNLQIRARDPSLVLVIGNFENMDSTDFKKALRSYDNRFSIIDYDTLISRFLGK